jgi:Holliday junction DNA helicase RuvA
MTVGSNVDEAVNALMVLGYTRGEAASALKGLSATLSIEELITAALKKLAT